MPAWRLDDQPRTINRYDVGGQDSDSEPEFVRHVGLCDDARSDLRCDTEVTLTHMGPPLRRGASGNPVQTIGLVPLTADQQDRIRVFVDEVNSEYEAHKARKAATQYTIRPHVRFPDETFSFRRFSCAGFVIEAYDYAGIDLISSDEKQLPRVTMHTLVRAYPDQAERLGDQDVRAYFGIGDAGPWPVVLAGYVLNALNRSMQDIESGEYVPTSGDEYFPPRRDAEATKPLQT